MQIHLNGLPHDIPSESSIATLLEQLELAGKRLAVEVNLDIVPRSQFADYQLKANDCVEIVHAIGGG